MVDKWEAALVIPFPTASQLVMGHTYYPRIVEVPIEDDNDLGINVTK